jgi:hypothetical protein
MSTPRACVLAVVLVVFPAVAQAQERSFRETATDLKSRAEQTVAAIDAYFANPAPSKGDAQELQQFRGFARELRQAMDEVVRVATPLAGSGSTFMERFDTTRARVDLVDLASRGRLNRFIPPVDGAPACCESLTKDAAPSEFALVEALSAAWKGFGPDLLAQSIRDMSAIYGKFEKKLLKGFPAMPWEYILNFHGDRNGPSPHQLILAHPSLGFEVDNKAAEGTSQARAVLAMQFGYNHYFFKGINYVGAAFIATANATAGRDRWRKGAAIHFGNVATVGATHGDDRWIVFVASDRLGDKLVGALVKLR